MANIIEIADLGAPGLEVFTRLTDAQLRRGWEGKNGVFIAEGVQIAQIALSVGLNPVALLIEKKHLLGKARALVAACGNAPVYTGGAEVLAQITGYPLTRGVLAAFDRPQPSSVREVCAGKRRIAVLEQLNDGANVGALFRCAAALGMDGLVLTKDCCDPYSRRAMRVSMGTVLQLPWCWCNGDLSELRALGYQTAAFALCDDAVSLEDERLKSVEQLAIVLGAEGSGLREATIQSADWRVKIPMAHGVDSLNVAAAGAVAFWQLRG